MQDASCMSSLEPEVTIIQLDQQLGREAGALQLRTQLKEGIWQALEELRSGCHPCQQDEPADQRQCAWAAAVPGTLC